MKKKKKQELSEKQKRFADLYLTYGCGTKAYVEAYQVENRDSARAGSWRLLRKPYMREYINARIEKMDAKRIAKQEEVLEFLTKVMRGEVVEEIPLGVGMGEQKLAEKGMEARDRIKAAELIGKRYGMWVERQETDLNALVQIVDDVPNPVDDPGDEEGE